VNRALVVVPTYNEAPNIRGLIESLLSFPAVDVLVADDSSPDGTAEIVEGLHLEHADRVRLVSQQRKGGRGAAVLAGFRAGIMDSAYDAFVEMDADLSHLPEELPRLLNAASAADIVIGSRYLEGGRILGWSLRRRIWSRMSNRLINAMLRLPVTDYTNGYRLYSRRAVETLLAATLHERGYISLSEWAALLHRHRLPFANVPTTFVNRRYGKSKMSLSEAAGALRGLIRLRRRHLPTP
jgi:dolichol-phosphate mannosyltransferase